MADLFRTPERPSPLRRPDTGGALQAADRLKYDYSGTPTGLRSFAAALSADAVGEARALEAEALVSGDESALQTARMELANRERLLEATPTSGSTSFSDARAAGDYGSYVANTLGSAAGSMAKPLLGAVVGGSGASALRNAIGGVAGGFAGSYDAIRNAEMNQIAGDSQLATLSPEQQLELASSNALKQAGLESALPAYMVAGGRLPGALNRIPRPARIAGTVAGEAGTEAAQSYISQRGAMEYFPDREIDYDELRENAIAGAIAGGAFSAVSGHGEEGSLGQQTQQDDAAAPPQDGGGPTQPPGPIAPNTPLLPAPETLGSRASELYENLSERFGPKVEETYGKASDYVSDVIDRMNEAVKTAETPQDFLRQVFRPAVEDMAAADALPDTEDAGVLSAADPAAAMQQRDMDRAARAAGFADELLNDPSTPTMIKDRIAAMGGDFSSPSNQAYIASTFVAVKGGQKVIDAVDSIVEFSKSFVDKAKNIASDAKDRISKKNLQDINEADIAPLVSLMAQRLGPTKAAEAPKMARQLVAAANRLSPDAKINAETDRRLRNFSKVVDDEVLDAVTAASGSDALRNAITKIRSIPSAASDVRQSGGQSFLESMLKQQLEPAVLSQLSEFVDTVGIQLAGMPAARKNQVLGALASAFGSKREAQTVVEYYGNMKRDAFRREAEAGTLHEDREGGDMSPGEVVATVTNPDGTVSYGAEFGSLTEQDAAEMTASYRDPNPARPFFRGTDRAALRAARRAAPAGSRVASLREYVAQTDEAPQAVAARVRQDLRKRLTDSENRDTATVQEAIASMEAIPEAERSEDFNQLLSQLKGRKTEDRTDLPGLRKQMAAIEKASGVSFKEIADLNRRIRRAELADEGGIDNDDIAKLPALRKQLSKLEDRYSKNAEKVLEKYAVVMRPKDETFANDELMAKFRGVLDKLPNANVGTPAERAQKKDEIAKIKKTAIKFNRKDGKTPITLSAESMAFASQARGSMEERFFDSLAAVLARPDIDGMVTPASDTLISRKTGLTWGDVAPEKIEDTRSEAQKQRARKAAQEKASVSEWVKQTNAKADFENRAGLMKALRDLQRQFLADRLGPTLAPDETISLTDLIDRFPPNQRRAMRTAANELAFNMAVGWAQQLDHKLATAEERNYRDESRMRVLEAYIDEQVKDRHPMPDGDERPSSRASAEEVAAGMYAEEAGVGGQVADLEAELAVLEDRIDAVAGIRGLEAKYERMVDAVERNIDELTDSVPSAEQRDFRVPGERAEKTLEQRGDEAVAGAASGQRTRKQSFVGAKADPEGAAKASEALDSGASAKLVWAMHGWFRGPDGKMRKELRSPVLRTRVREFAENLLGQRLGTAEAEFEGVSADQLFDGVPGYEKLLKTLGKYTISLEDSPKIGLHGMVGVVADRTLTMSVDGAGLQAVLRKYAADELAEVVDNGVLDPTDMFSSARDAVREGYLPKFESVEAFEREVLAEVERTIHHELQHILQGVEGFENGGNPNVAIISKYGDLRAFESALKDGYYPAVMEELERARSAMLADIGPDADPEAVAHDLYRNIMGEVEAHDVEARFNLSDAEAKRILPEMMNPNREFLRGIKVAIDAAKLVGKQNRQTTVGGPRKPPNAKEHAKLKKKLVDEIRRIRGNDVRVRFNRLIKNLGASGEFSMNPDKTDRLIEVAVNAADPMGVAWHESLHDFFAMLGEDKVGRSIKRDLTQAASAPHVKKRLRELLKDHPKALEQIEKSPEERVAYMYQFWAAGELQLGPTGTGIFEQLRQFFRDLLHVVGRDERAADLLTALHEGNFAEPSTVAEVLADMPRDRVFNRLERTAPALTDALQKMAKVAPDRLRAYQNEHLDRLADMFSSEQGELGFVQRRFRRDGEWTNKLAGILAGTKAVERRKALDNLQAMKAPSSKLERDLAKFFEDMHGYMLEAGVQTRDSKTKKWVPIRQVKNYFPRVFDREAITKDRDGFKKLLMQHGQMTAAAAENTIKALVHGTGQLDLAENEHALGFTPYAQSVQDRQLTFINPSNAAAFAKYQSKDLADITTVYVKQAAHRAEYARMFGNNGEKIAEIIAESGITDKKELADIEKTVQGLEGTLGYEMSNQTKELMSGVMTLQNLVILPLAIFSQMIDPVVLASRSGEVKDAGNAYMTAIKRMAGKDVDGEDLAEMLGIVSQDTVLDAMGVAYGTTHMSKRMRNINRVFFKYNGMQGWNNSMRIAATAAGERYLLQNRNNREALAELGLEPSDIKTVASYRGVKPDANNKVVLRDRLDVSSPKVKEAMFRFVDQSVLRPSASNRPVWMSDPKFLLLAHLKQFTFTMHNVVLKRASQQLDEGNPKPWAILMLAMPTILAADMAKFALTGGPPPGWGFKEFLAHAVERSGLLGLGDFGAQAMKGVEQGRVPGEALLGPSVEHLMDLLRFLSGSPSVSSGDVLDRSVPGARFF